MAGFLKLKFLFIPFILFLFYIADFSVVPEYDRCQSEYKNHNSTNRGLVRVEHDM